MNNIEKNPWLILLPRMVLGLFIIFNIIAMFVYPGSTFLNNSSEGYSFTQNFLSDLGRTMSFSGQINYFSAQFFNMSLILAGTVFSFLCYCFPVVDYRYPVCLTNMYSPISLTGNCFSLIECVGFFLILFCCC